MLIENYLEQPTYPLVRKLLFEAKNGIKMYLDWKDKEHIFLSGDNYWIMQDMLHLRSVTVVNPKTGKEQIKKKFPLGMNTAKISDIRIKKTKNKSLYIHVEFVRDHIYREGKRVNFAPLVDRFFTIEKKDSKGFTAIQQLLRALGTDLKNKPPNYPTEDYIKAVARRIRDHCKNPVEMGVRYNKELIRDEYGELELKKYAWTHWKPVPTISFKEEVAFYGSYKYDWSKAIIPMNDRDFTDHDYYYSQAKYGK